MILFQIANFDKNSKYSITILKYLDFIFQASICKWWKLT